MSELEVTRVMSDLRGLYERGKLSDEQIARLDAIGFNWERQKRIKPTLDSRLAELWDEEKAALLELPQYPFSVFRYTTKTGFATIETNKYGLSPMLAGEKVQA